jgi:hypothetical protein
VDAEERELLRDILRLVARIERRLAGRRPSLARADFELLRVLVPAWGGRLGSRATTTSRILADPVLGAVCAGVSARKLGKVLAKAADTRLEVAGIRVRRLRVRHGAVVWQAVQVVSKLPSG